MKQLTYGSLFAGVGGFDIAFDRCGLQGTWQVENDPKAQSILRRHWPDVPKYDDVRHVGAHNLVPVDIICGGFPCQDLSIAGTRNGLSGARSGLFYEMARIVNELQPAFLVWENVVGLLSSDKGRDFGRVINTLADIGYCGAYRVLNAQFFGVPQRRRRVFGVFARGDIGAERCAEILALCESVRGDTAPRGKKGQDAATDSGTGPQSGGRELASAIDVRNLALRSGTSGTLQAKNSGSYSLNYTNPVFIPAIARRQTTGVGKHHDANAETYVLQHAQIGRKDEAGPRCMSTLAVACFDTRNITSKANRTRVEFGAPANTLHAEALSIIIPPCIRRLTPRECERLQGFPDDWTRWTYDGKEQADANRYRQMGNAVAVPVVMWIARRLIENIRRVSLTL